MIMFMSMSSSNIQATQSTSALQHQPRQPRHVEYALQMQMQMQMHMIQWSLLYCY